MIRSLTISTTRQGMLDITALVQAIIAESGVKEGLCTIFVRHTSASLLIQENADPSARHDLEAWMTRIAPEGDPHFTHNDEGLDDMPSHIRAALTSTSLGIPILDGALALGRWQGIYLWEHRRKPHERQIVVHVA